MAKAFAMLGFSRPCELWAFAFFAGGGGVDFLGWECGVPLRFGMSSKELTLKPLKMQGGSGHQCLTQHGQKK